MIRRVFGRKERMATTCTIAKTNDASTPERIHFLDSLRAIAIIMVVSFHASSYCIPLPEHQKTIIILIANTVSVPLFFFVDGYLFAHGVVFSKDYTYSQHVRKSMCRLLVPWIVFTLFYVITRYCFEMSGFQKETLIIGHSFQEVMLSAYGSVYASQMYFLASLFLVRVCGPLFKKIVLIKQYVVLLLVFFCYFLAYRSCIGFISPYLRIDGGQEPILHALWGIQYYFTGIVIYKTSEILDLKRLFVPFVLLFLIALIAHDRLGSVALAFGQYSYLMTLFLLFMIVQTRLPFLEMIGRNTMGIYLLHAPLVLKGVSLVLNRFVSIPIVSFFAILLGTFFLTCCIVITVKRIPYGVLLFGER